MLACTNFGTLVGLSFADNPMMAAQFGDVPYRVKFDYLAPTLNPVTSIMASYAPTINPTKTYESATEDGTQYDILWVPAGMPSDAVTGFQFLML
jgi:hypothetical protein